MPERDPLLTELPSLADAPADVRAAAVADEAYWKKLCPMLHVCDPDLRRQLRSAIIDPDPDLVDELRARMARDGYWDIDATARRADSGDLQLPWLVSVEAMAQGLGLL